MMFRADLYSRFIGATIVDALLRLITKMDERVCTGPEVLSDTGFDIYLFFSVRAWVILDYLKEYCLNGHVNIWGYVNGR